MISYKPTRESNSPRVQDHLYSSPGSGPQVNRESEFDVTLESVVRVSADERIQVAIPLTIHSCHSGVIIVNSHGLGGTKEGYHDKYVKIARLLVRLNVGSVVRFQYAVDERIGKPLQLIETLRSVLDHILDNAKLICGSDTPELYLAGVSAGASVSATVGSEYSQVTKMLLISPSGDAGVENVKRGLSSFEGELYITIGDQDHIVGPETVRTFSEWATKARLRRVVIVPECDHQFSGEKNGRIFSKAYLWAFKEDDTYPSPEGGIKLY